LGAKDYLIKSNFDPQEILTKINSYLNDWYASFNLRAFA
jgi:DNA-binding response OmpR family regulator